MSEEMEARDMTASDLNELRQKAIDYSNETWGSALFWGGDSPWTANYWYVDGRPDLSYCPFPLRCDNPGSQAVIENLKLPECL